MVDAPDQTLYFTINSEWASQAHVCADVAVIRRRQNEELFLHSRQICGKRCVKQRDDDGLVQCWGVRVLQSDTHVLSNVYLS